MTQDFHHFNTLQSTHTAIKEEEGRQLNNEESPRAWQCGEPYQYPLPAPEGDPWQILLAPILERDKAQCEAWKDEVQNLLIFAGLFSAVVTAFTIETYKGLQQDPSNTMILLLSTIANNLQNSQNNNTEAIPISQPAFSPTLSTVRVNIFMFMSLILSLATVLIGIVSLQWLREHQAYTGSFTPQNTFAAVHMRSEALEKWRVPEIFSALPLILQSALILFFVGVIDFLLNIDIHVVIPVAIVIGLTLVFLLLTTMLPTLQAFILHHPYLKLNDEVPVQCPYKSPQSRAFRRLITSSKLVFVVTSFTFATIYWIIMRLCLLPGQIVHSRFCQSIWQSFMRMIHSLPAINLTYLHRSPFFALLRLNQSKPWDGFGYMTRHIYGFWSVTSSFDFDLVWLSVRDNYFQSTCSPDSWLYRNRFDHQDHGAIYDAILGLCKELTKDDVNMNADFESPIFTAYHCALDPSSINQLRGDEQIKAARTRNAYLTTLLGYNPLTPLSPFPDIIQDPTLSLLWEENAFVVLNFAYSKLYDLDLSSPRLSRHLAELSFRLLSSEDGPPDVLFAADELYVMKIFDDKDQPFTTQWALTLDLYFRAFGSPNAVDIDFKGSFHGHRFIREYIWNFWKEIDSEFTNKNIHSDTLKQILNTFHLINDILKNLLESENAQILECIYYPAALYTQSCRRLLPDHERLNENIGVLIPSLLRCRDTIALRGSQYQPWKADGEYDEDQKLPLFSEEWWDILFSSDRESYVSRSTGSAQPQRGSIRSRETPTGHHRSSSQLDDPVPPSRRNITCPLDLQTEQLPRPNARIDDTLVSDENRGAENLV
ncbi:hypothetical protein BJ912DRAFT_927908 [Pholiota molesta]|nr:hypothetical protein BJ912DRAFT_927908 [Pholiota molesta]